MGEMQKGPLDGLLVVAIEQAVAAPLCTQRLVDAGARVIKIEREVGETARHYDTAVHGTSAYFAWLNRGKESSVFDLKDRNDLAVVERMIVKADVLVSNLAPGAIDRLGFGADDLAKLNPKLISLAIVGYGQDTPYADARAYDALVQAESGVCSVTGTPESAVKVGVSVADISTGMNAHAAILEALIQRSITGRGKAIEMSMFDSLADWMNVPLLHNDYLDNQVARAGLAHASIYPYGSFPCSDGEVMIVVQNPAEWHRLCVQFFKRADLETDPRFESNPMRDKNRNALDAEMKPILCAMTCAEAMALLKVSNLASAQINDVTGVSAHPALHRAKAQTNGAEFEFAAPPLHLNGPIRQVPELGQHTQAIRTEFSA